MALRLPETVSSNLVRSSWSLPSRFATSSNLSVTCAVRSLYFWFAVLS